MRSKFKVVETDKRFLREKNLKERKFVPFSYCSNKSR